MYEAAGVNFKILGTTGYGSALRTFEARIPLADLAAADNTQLPLFIIPKGTVTVAVRATVNDPVQSGANATLKVGTFKIADGALGTAIDDDGLFSAVALAGKVAGDVVAPAATAHGAMATEDAAVVATLVAASSSPVAPTEGEILIEMWALP